MKHKQEHTKNENRQDAQQTRIIAHKKNYARPQGGPRGGGQAENPPEDWAGKSDFCYEFQESSRNRWRWRFARLNCKMFYLRSAREIDVALRGWFLGAWLFTSSYLPLSNHISAWAQQHAHRYLLCTCGICFHKYCMQPLSMLRQVSHS